MVAEHYKTSHSVPLVQTAMQNLKNLKLIGYAIPAPAKEISSAFSQPFGFMLLHYGIVPALLPYAAMSILIWRLLRSSLHIHDQPGRTLAIGGAVYFAVWSILMLLRDVLSMRMLGYFIPFNPVYGLNTALTAGLLGLLFGLYRRKELYIDDESATAKVIGPAR